MAEQARAEGPPDSLGVALDSALDPPGVVRSTAVGISASVTCGVRDYARLLARALGDENMCCSLFWLERRNEPLLEVRSQIRSWTQRFADQISEDRSRVVLLHYSVFSYSYRGLPVFVSPILAALRRTGIPIVTVLHEFVYPWGHTGVRGATWAVSQRAVLVDVMRSSAAVLVTADSRARWLASRAWLAKPPLGVSPVFSNIPPATTRPPRERDRVALGLFGYSYPPATIAVVLDALKLFGDQGGRAQLRLLGSPGRPSAIADAWLAAARMRALTDGLVFSGTLSAQDLADALADCDILLFADPPGPTSRKTTLAASLASGRPVVALDGSQSWVELAQADAAMIVSPMPSSLADAIATLQADESAADALGGRGKSFAQDMGVRRSARTVTRLIDDIIS
jgi:glycosyltransferase involved in cell wall biosynthesis